MKPTPRLSPRRYALGLLNGMRSPSMANHARIATTRPAIKSAEYLKHKNPHAEVAVRDRMTGDTRCPVRAP
jgi:hypothetical protein